VDRVVVTEAVTLAARDRLRRPPCAVVALVQRTDARQIRKIRDRVPAANALRVLEKEQMATVIAVKDLHSP
jgi:hypothetical protein